MNTKKKNEIKSSKRVSSKSVKSKSPKPAPGKNKKPVKKPIVNKQPLQLKDIQQQEINRLKSALDIEKERSIQKEIEWRDLLTAQIDKLEKKRLKENQLFQSQIDELHTINNELSQAQIKLQQDILNFESALHIEREKYDRDEKEWRECLSARTAEITRLENERSLEYQRTQAQIERLQELDKESSQSQIQLRQDIALLGSNFSAEQKRTEILNKQVEELNESKNNLVRNLEQEREKKISHAEKIAILEKQLQDGNLIIENLLKQKIALENQFQDKKQQIALEWARGLGEVLTKLSALAEKEPEPVRGLKPRSVYETLLNWLEKTFGERPRMFPSPKEFTKTSAGDHLITLDADADGIEALLKRYDWSHELPFEKKEEGQRQVKFKLMQWGWKVGDTILVRANITIWHSDLEINHE